MIIEFYTHYIPKEWPNVEDDKQYWPKVKKRGKAKRFFQLEKDT